MHHQYTERYFMAKLRSTLIALSSLAVISSLTMIPVEAHAQETVTPSINRLTGQLTPADKPAFGEEDAERAEEIFKSRCTRCHGSIGNGRGSLASHLSPRPTDLTSAYWYKSTSVKTLKRVILGGGGAIGKSVLMPANPDLRNKPKVVAALVQYIINLAPRKTE